MRSVHAGQLERWLGPEAENISRQMKGWYGPGIPVSMPGGNLTAMPDGDFRGQLWSGKFASYRDYALDRVKRTLRNCARGWARTPQTGFASLSDLITEATTGGKRQEIFISKVCTFPTTAFAASLWAIPAMPPGGTAAATAIPGGEVPNNTTAGGLLQADPDGADTLHFVSALMQGSAAPNTLLVYDRIFHAGSILHTTTGNQAITGVPTRYTSATASPGNFCFLEVHTGSLGSTAHNATITYTDTVPNAAEGGSAQVVTVSSVVTRIPLAKFYYQLNADDRGVTSVTNVAFSAVSTGVSNIVVGHPLMWIPCPVAGVMTPIDGVNSMFNLVKIEVDACMAMLEMKAVGTATTYTGSIILVSG